MPCVRRPGLLDRIKARQRVAGLYVGQRRRGAVPPVCKVLRPGSVVTILGETTIKPAEALWCSVWMVVWMLM